MSDLVSGEGVALELRHAGLGSRSVAAGIDVGVQIAVLLVAFVITGAIGAGDADAQAALGLLEVVLVLAGYPILFEWLTHGRTLGKMAMGLRVVRDDGGPIGFRQASVRGLAGFVLEKPGIVLGGLGIFIGMITIGSSRASKRVGDMMAGTFVLNERTGPATALQPLNWWVPPALYGWAQSLDLTGVDDRLALQIRQFVTRAEQMSPGAQATLGEQFRAEVTNRIAPPPPPGVPTPIFLTTILAERRRRAEWRSSAPLTYSSPTVTPSPDGAFAPPG